MGPAAIPCWTLVKKPANGMRGRHQGAWLPLVLALACMMTVQFATANKEEQTPSLAGYLVHLDPSVSFLRDWDGRAYQLQLPTGFSAALVPAGKPVVVNYEQEPCARPPSVGGPPIVVTRIEVLESLPTLTSTASSSSGSSGSSSSSEDATGGDSSSGGTTSSSTATPDNKWLVKTASVAVTGGEDGSDSGFMLPALNHEPLQLLPSPAPSYPSVNKQSAPTIVPAYPPKQAAGGAMLPPSPPVSPGAAANRSPPRPPLLAAGNDIGGSIDGFSAPSFSADAGETSPGPTAPGSPAGVAEWAVPWANPTLVARDISAVFLIVTVCGHQPAVTQQDIEALLFRDAAPEGGRTLEGYYGQCSLGVAGLSRNNSRVVGGLEVGCEGESPNFGPWSAYSCAYSDYFGWAEAAGDAAAATGVDLSLYRHRVVVLPPYVYEWAGPACSDWGLGTVGPAYVGPVIGTSSMTVPGVYAGQEQVVQDWADGQFAYVWVSGEKALDIQAYFHELGHNFGLAHAGRFNSEQCQMCDWSSAMGACCRVRCFNAPHNWQLGWAVPVPGGVLNSSSLKPGTTRTFVLPAATTRRDNMAIVVLDTTPPADAADGVNALFLSYRPFEGGEYDREFPYFYAGGILVHTWTGVSQSDARQPTDFKARLMEGQSWSDGQLVVRALPVMEDTSSGGVTLCRLSRPGQTCEAECGDGLDNDCDGLVDEEDPDCQAASACQAYPPSPRPPLAIEPLSPQVQWVMPAAPPPLGSEPPPSAPTAHGGLGSGSTQYEVPEAQPLPPPPILIPNAPNTPEYPNYPNYPNLPTEPIAPPRPKPPPRKPRPPRPPPPRPPLEPATPVPTSPQQPLEPPSTPPRPPAPPSPSPAPPSPPGPPTPPSPPPVPAPPPCPPPPSPTPPPASPTPSPPSPGNPLPSPPPPFPPPPSPPPPSPPPPSPPPPSPPPPSSGPPSPFPPSPPSLSPPWEAGKPPSPPAAGLPGTPPLAEPSPPCPSPPPDTSSCSSPAPSNSTAANTTDSTNTATSGSSEGGNGTAVKVSPPAPGESGSGAPAPPSPPMPATVSPTPAPTVPVQPPPDPPQPQPTVPVYGSSGSRSTGQKQRRRLRYGRV